ncbi:Uncharacterised protein [uncultured Roseburia sp.]|uniref:DUF5685 family protein n=1 Tax=Brotonthovivens ammoniilytica TaxID=2981725 RepID=A0ABT2TLD6_9FIRM|nr:DUF5685 family protein [Brotonthovivens ammoniilytica]MCU6763023.1 DUF5685 family protein [Brotonthovivens ammoniilytica]SCJ00776.1 Uncharacterised protein [uncultured Roseburia sp.]
MFGYINVNRKELTEENLKIYQSYYCGLCQSLKKNTGIKGQMLLNYDMTFLIVLLTGLYELEDEEKEFICAIHPGKKKLARMNEATQYAAAMNVMLAYHNLEDDWRDERAYAKRAIFQMIKKDYQKIAGEYPRQAEALETYMKRLTAYERSEEHNIDLIAGLTGEMLGEIFAWKEDVWAEELKCLGFYMGKFIYLMDAYEDLDKDEKNKTYNLFSDLKKENQKDFETLSKLILTSMMSECSKSFERMPILLYADILRNILYSGVWSKYEYIQLKKKKRRKSR